MANTTGSPCIKVCSECGREFYVSTLIQYQYKMYPPKSKKNSKRNMLYQCSYTCNDHAILRYDKIGYITKENFLKYVKRSEDKMRSQGKNILHPITDIPKDD